MVNVFYIIVTYYPHWKRTHNLKVMEFEVYRNSKTCFKFSKGFYHM
jgi:hypothetical protein